MKILNIFFVVFCLVIACANKENPPQHEENQSNEKHSDLIKFNCDSVKRNIQQLGSNEFFLSELNINKKLLNSVNKDFYTKYLSEEFSPDLYFYSYLNLSGCSIIFYEHEVIDNVSERLTLVSFDNVGKIISRISLGENISYPDGRIKVYSLLKKDELIQTRVASSIGDYDKLNKKYFEVIDSITTRFKTSNTGIFELIKKDSIRITR